MDYWGASTLPMYSSTRGVKRKAAKKKGTDAPPSANASSKPPSPTAQRKAGNISNLLEPAVDGPPSPESIRALSKQMKRASVADKHHSQQTTSSGSSSVRSRGSVDRPSWEQALEGISLSRKSSGRSTSSSMPSRERPDSVQIFGKTIFNRRNKLKREGSAQSSSGSSLYSADVPPESMPPMSAISKDALIPNLFNRRRTMRPDMADDPAAQKRFQISGPYNFQHVTHTQRDHLPNFQRTSRMALASEFTALRASQAPSHGALRGIHADDLSFSDFSSDTFPLQEEDEFPSEMTPPHGFVPSQLALQKQTSPPRRLVKHTRSQEQLRVPPPRPPRSPVEPPEPPSSAPPVPPPRISSRISIRYDGFDPLGSTTLDRPQTSGGFRHPQPLSIFPEHIPPPATSHGFGRENDMDMLPQEYRFSRVVSPPDDVNWPLPCPPNTSFETPLPDVPEEEEHYMLSRQSRASLASNNSSLRGSQSVPLLRQLAQSQSAPTVTQRPPSGASDTLGRFDLLAAQRSLKAALNGANESEALPRASWEDDIDYCYEHEAEADCDFDWDRPSLEMERDDVAGQADFELADGDEREVSPPMLTPGRFDMPALSPASQASTVTKHEAVTPTAPAMPVTSNFSLPRGEAPPPQRFLSAHARSESHASTFKESHGFNLSPSLLIPGDFRQQMLVNEADELLDHDGLCDFSYDEPTLTMKKLQPRTSASTTASESERSGSERHISGTSASTDLTRLTMSTSSLDMESYIPKHDRPESLVVDESEFKHMRSSGKSLMPIVPESEESPDRTGAFRGFAQEPEQNAFPTLGEDAPPTPLKRRDSLHSRRQRTRASSIPPPPPAGQYSMFPSVKVYGTHI